MPPGLRTRWVFYAVPILFCIAVHWIALKTWFRADDFAWLGLHLDIWSPHDFFDVLFGWRAQGTIRTISERLYFLTFSWLFGLNALPFRIWAFLTQIANIVLLMRITRHITGSTRAAFLAPILWSANAGLAIALNWSSAYNEICFAFFLLLAFYLFLTEQWVAQWIVFLLGFFVLELNVMYPAIAAGYALCCARQHLRSALYLFIPSGLFTVLHFLYAPKTTDPSYMLHLDWAIPVTLWKYWSFATGAARPDQVDWRPLWLGIALSVIVTVALIAFAIRRGRTGAFLLAWFVIVLLPVLPLREHFTEYYLTVPTLGLAILGAWALGRKSAYALALIYVVVSATDIHGVDQFFYAHARWMKRIVQGLEANRSVDAGKTVLFSGVTNDIFWSGFGDDPFRLIGLYHVVYLTPGSEKAIDPHPEWGGISRFVISLDDTVKALKSNQATVYNVNANGIRNVTGTYKVIAMAQYLSEHRDFVDTGDPDYASRLGAGWYPIENHSRWMAKSATVQLSGPTRPGQMLLVTGYCPATVPIVLSLRADQYLLGSATLRNPSKPFSLQLPMPSELTGKYAIEIQVEVNHTITPANDPRPLGLIFGKFRIE